MLLHPGPPGFNTEAAYDPTNDMTLVMWGNLTVALENTSYSPMMVMVKVLDRICALSPLAPQASADVAP